MVTYNGNGLDTGTAIFIADSVSQLLTRSGSLTGSTESSDALSVGNPGNLDGPFDGAIDELRISKGIARTPDYAITSSNNQKEMTDFWTLETEVVI